MKTKAIAQISLATGLLSLSLAGTACGADTLPNPSNSASPSFTMSSSTPELEAADQRVKQTDAQLQVAKKQLIAAKSLLRAAEADLRAAKADKQALALNTQAQGLAAEAGMTPSTAPRALAQAPARVPALTSNGITTTNVDLLAAPPTAPSRDGSVTKPVSDFDAEPVDAEETSARAPSLQLR